MPRLEHRIIGSQHVYTSPDVPGLFVAHADQQTALDSVPSAIKVLEEMKARRKQRDKVAAAVNSG